MIILSFLYAHSEQLFCYFRVSVFHLKTVAIRAYRDADDIYRN